MATLISRSSEETFAIGETWGREAQRGWVVGLSGDLGAGKTQLVKGIARGLGFSGQVHSPTFALLNEYRGGRLPVFHIDLYRLENPEQVRRAGLEEFLLKPDGVTVVEWIEKWTELKPKSNANAQVVRFVHIETLGETERRITYEDSGA